jgi:hypothetical protein
MNAYIDTHAHRFIHTYMHACIHTFINTHIHAYIHTYIHAYIHVHIDSYIHTYIHTQIHNAGPHTRGPSRGTHNRSGCVQSKKESASSSRHVLPRHFRTAISPRTGVTKIQRASTPLCQMGRRVRRVRCCSRPRRRRLVCVCMCVCVCVCVCV